MKKLLLTVTLSGALLGFGTVTQAQDAQPGRGQRGQRANPEERLKRMTESLSLTQEQQDKIKAIFEKNKSKIEEAQKAPEGERRAKMQEVMKAQNEEITAVLTPEQKEKQEKQRAEAQKRRAERGNGGGGQKPNEAK